MPGCPALNTPLAFLFLSYAGFIPHVVANFTVIEIKLFEFKLKGYYCCKNAYLEWKINYTAIVSQ